jgi:uncharacterized protein YbjT (DUF2867 family)
LKPSSTVLVMGATGRLGTRVLDALLRTSHAVCAVVRRGAPPELAQGLNRRGVQVIEADLTEPATLRSACQGVSCVVSTATAMRSPRANDSLRRVDGEGQMALIESAEAAGVERFVYVSFAPFPFEFALQRLKRAVEARLQQSRMVISILRPVHFAEVWLSAAFQFDPMRGRVRIFGDGTRALNWISIDDVARFVVAAVETANFAGAVVPLGGPDAMSQLEIVDVFRRFGAPPIRFEYIDQASLQNSAKTADPVAEARAFLALSVAQGFVTDTKPALALLPAPLLTAPEYVLRLIEQQDKREGESHG